MSIELPSLGAPDQAALQPSRTIRNTHDSDEDDLPVRFGAWLVRRGLISRSELFRGLCEAFRVDYRIGDALVALGLLERRCVETEAALFESEVKAKRFDGGLQIPPTAQT